MAFVLTDRNKSLKDQINKNTQAVLQIEGLETVFGSQPVLIENKWDIENLFWDQDGVNWDGFSEKEDSITAISLDSSTNRINQQIYPDKASSGSVSNITIKFTDLNNEVSKAFALENIDEILGKKADFYIGFKQGSFPEDMLPVFRGVIVDFYTQNGSVSLTVAHPDTLKRQSVFEQYLSPLTSDIDDLVTTIPVVGTEELFTDVDTLTSYIKIDDEIMKVNSKAASSISVTRAQFGTIATNHSSSTEVTSQYRLTGNPIDLALKLMLSDEENSYFDSDDIPASISNNSLIFDYFDIQDLTGLVSGDEVRLTGVNAGDYLISGFGISGSQSFITLDATLTDETEFVGEFSYRSKYNRWPSGLGMLPFQVDVQGHEDIFNFNPSLFVDYEIDLKETVEEAKTELLEEQIYFPQGLYAIPRRARSSVKLILPPLTSEILPTFNTDNILNLPSVAQRRSIHKYHYNIFRIDYEQDEIEDKFKRKEILINNTSRDRIKSGNKVLKIESKGFRDNAPTNATILNILNRYKDRYSFAPKYFDGVKLNYKTGFNIEVGDVVPFGGEDTQIVDIETGLRNQTVELFEIYNKSLDLKTGQITVSLLQTSFNIQARYAVFSPSSSISGATTTSLPLFPTSLTEEFSRETEKWEEFIGETVLIRTDDYTYFEETKIVGIDPQNNTVLIVDALPSSPPDNSIIEIPFYENTDPSINSNYKLRFAHMTARVLITGVTNAQEFDVDEPGELFVGSRIVVSSLDYTRDSFGEEVEIANIVGSTVTLNQSLSFTPLIGDKVENSDFGDGGEPYQLI